MLNAHPKAMLIHVLPMKPSGGMKLTQMMTHAIARSLFSSPLMEVWFASSKDTSVISTNVFSLHCMSPFKWHPTPVWTSSKCTTSIVGKNSATLSLKSTSLFTMTSLISRKNVIKLTLPHQRLMMFLFSSICTWKNRLTLSSLLNQPPNRLSFNSKHCNNFHLLHLITFLNSTRQDSLLSIL